MTVFHRYALLMALVGTGLAAAPAKAENVAARCEVIPESMAAYPPSVGELKSPTRTMKPAHDVRLRVVVGANGTAINVDAESTENPEPARRSASLWRYRCDGNQGGTAEWVLHYPAQKCQINISSKNFNPPRYPTEAFKAGVEGTVLLALQPQGNGLLTGRAYVAQGSGSTLLDEAALDGSKRWSFFCIGPIDGSEPAQEVPVDYLLY